MNVSKWAFEGTPNYPVKLTKVSEGEFKVTSVAVKDREWVGETEEKAMKVFRDDMAKEHERLQLDNQPKWMEDVKKGEWL